MGLLLENTELMSAPSSARSERRCICLLISGVRGRCGFFPKYRGIDAVNIIQQSKIETHYCAPHCRGLVSFVC